MKNIFRLAAVAVVALSLNSCCGGCDAPKFNAKEYAKNKTERLDKLVELTDAQEKEIYNIYLAQGKEMKKNMAAAKKACGDMKCPDGKKAECAKPCPPKPECGKKADCPKKAECNKPCEKKPECTKPCEKKAECTKPCEKKANCDKPCEKKAECGKKAECHKKAECAKPCDKKANCEKPCAKKAECAKPCEKKANCNKPCAKKAECTKPCEKKANCEKPCAKKAECAKPCAKPEGYKKAEGCKPCPKGVKPECGKPQKPNFHRHEFVSPEAKKATFEQIRSVLTEEQNNKIHEHFAKRKQFAPKVKACAPTAAPCEK